MLTQNQIPKRELFATNYILVQHCGVLTNGLVDPMDSVTGPMPRHRKLPYGNATTPSRSTT